MFNQRHKKRRTNLNILSQTLKEVAKEDDITKPPANIGFVPEEPAQKKEKPSKRELTIDGNGIVEKHLHKKGLEFINFKNLLTS